MVAINIPTRNSKEMLSCSTSMNDVRGLLINMCSTARNIFQSVKTASSRQLCLPALTFAVFIFLPRLIRDRVAGNVSWIHAPPVDAFGVAPEMADVTDQSDVFLSMVQDIATELDLHQVGTLIFFFSCNTTF